MVWLPDGEKIEDIFIRFDTMHERDRRTHTHSETPHDGISRAPRLCIASRGKNYVKPSKIHQINTIGVCTGLSLCKNHGNFVKMCPGSLLEIWLDL